MALERVAYVLGVAGSRELSIDVDELASIDPDDLDAVERAIKDRILDDVLKNVDLEDLVPHDAVEVIERFSSTIRDAREDRARAAARTRTTEARAALGKRRATGGGSRGKAGRR